MLPDKDISIGNHGQQQGDDLARSKVYHLSYSGEKAAFKRDWQRRLMTKGVTVQIPLQTSEENVLEYRKEEYCIVRPSLNFHEKDGDFRDADTVVEVGNRIQRRPVHYQLFEFVIDDTLSSGLSGLRANWKLSLVCKTFGFVFY